MHSQFGALLELG